ncbi:MULTISPECIES: TRAP transporter small permease subunit [unclassified Oleiphilus]|jgi:TRAP-type mannitol/chloroaromatic compound transport system permease small subunit|uniref:TRAP transporter small permease subunit n=1 Tax=unclassified Oleiphilus TaxID=2631174 RepID=UPI0007C271F8|nr:MULTISPECIES: TRAP transporter small permease subunit [unclassified Oleiphilus]KZY44655.1 C4-dicarboxylate ABC transporter [Oleiphilus sp. HI0050]KZZ35253.1 C4-dicarboxylate ABC transporter [Oleiphilus sp. HI0086]KZZ37429.1 C4-dicarboxylate ABC transporter [Oleiphilus sp. HI0117]KZZ61344.1 C4-dicarboxylate ABC transporter [Oleiphilus sp. HI0123]KZZ75574.1 C4-dicarboxylate ABC transporter [Oleiphilus sp. HI0132]
MQVILALDTLFKSIARLCGVLSASAMLLLLINVFYDVVMRYGFNDVSIGMQELEWHLFSCVFLLGIPYAIQENAHVRVDIFYDHWQDQTKAWINLLGTLILILPFIILVTHFSLGFAYESYQMGEGSGDPGGLPHRWLIKSLMPLSFILIGLASLSMITQALRVIVGKEAYPRSKEVGLS